VASHIKTTAKDATFGQKLAQLGVAAGIPVSFPGNAA
jgi:ABC-type transporter lipoprotein component MlaA